MAEVFTMRTSERSTFKRCPQRWVWSIVEQLESNKSKPALWFGSAVHEALALWYQPGKKRGPHPAETILDFIDEGKKIYVTNDEEELQFAEARILGVQMMNRYVNFYGNDESWEMIAPEQTFQVWIPHPNGENKRWLRYVGTCDGIYIDLETGEVWLLEHKTAAQIKTTHLPLDDQAGSYWAIMNSKLRKMGILKGKQSIAGIKYNFLRKALDDERPHNPDGLATNKPLKKHYEEALLEQGAIDLSGKETLKQLEELAESQDLIVYGDVSASQPPPYFERVEVYRSISSRANMIRRIQAEGLHMEAIKTGALPVYKTPTRDCDWHCDFFRLCTIHEEGGEFFEDYKESEFHTRDPYADHRGNKKSAGE